MTRIQILQLKSSVNPGNPINHENPGSIFSCLWERACVALSLTHFLSYFLTHLFLFFTIPNSPFTTLSIYNISGQKIRELAAGYMTAGAHSITWDGRDDGGDAVSSGVYITRLVAGKQVSAGRMVFLK